MDSEGKLRLKPKEDVKLELGRSPDIGDTIIYRAWFELQKDVLQDTPERAKARERIQNQFSISRGKIELNSTK